MNLRRSPASPLTVPVWGLFIVALFYVLQSATIIVVPVLVAVIVAATLAPLQAGLQQLRVPRPLAAGIIVITVVAVLYGALMALKAPAAAWMERVLEMITKLEPLVDGLRSEVTEVKRTSSSVESIASLAEPTPRDSITVDVREPSLLERALSGTPMILGLIGSTIFLVYFMLAVGDQTVAAIANAFGESRDRQKVYRVISETRAAISRYLATVTVINLVLGALAAALFYWIGLPNVLLWGAMVSLLNFVPYLGALASIAIVTLVSISTFGATAEAALAPSLFFLLTTLEGQFVTPLILGGGLHLNPLLIFVSILGLGMLWGIPGAIIAVPLLVSFAIASTHSDTLRPVSAVIRLTKHTPVDEVEP